MIEKWRLKMNEIHEKLENIFKYAKQINESRKPITGIWYYIYLEPKWQLYIYKADEYQNISHLEAWIKYIVPKLKEFYGLDKKDILEDAYRGFPRGRVDLNTSPEIIDPSNKFMIFHGDDFPSGLNRITEEGKILNGFNLAGLIARGLAKFEFAEHETMDPGHKEVVENVISTKIPY
jgi:hypothetical protein